MSCNYMYIILACLSQKKNVSRTTIKEIYPAILILYKLQECYDSSIINIYSLWNLAHANVDIGSKNE